MRWIEVIQLRFVENDQETLGTEVEKLIGEISGKRGLQEVRLYRHATIANDLFIQLHWKSAETKPKGSDVGLSLVHLLKEFGLTHHSVWEEREKVMNIKTMTRRQAGFTNGSDKSDGVDPLP